MRSTRHLLRLATVTLTAAAACLAVAAPAAAHPTTLTVAPAATSVSVGSAIQITLTFTDTDTKPRYATIQSAALLGYSDLVSCTGAPTAPSSCTSTASGYKATFPSANAGAGQTAVFNLTAVAATAINTVTAKVYENGILAATKTFTITVTNPSADLAVQNFGYSTDGLRFNYVAAGTNAGPAAVAATITFSVNQPASFMTPNGASIEEGPYTACNVVGQTIVCTSPSHGVGELGGITSSWTVGLLSLGSFTVTATISSPATDPNPANNTTSMTCTVLTGLIISC